MAFANRYHYYNSLMFSLLHELPFNFVESSNNHHNMYVCVCVWKAAWQYQHMYTMHRSMMIGARNSIIEVN